MAVILASSCLLGCECRYKGDGCKCDALIKLAESNTIIGVCPEQMGGLPTPRDPAERQGDKVISCVGKDVTKAYTKGAETALHPGVYRGRIGSATTVKQNVLTQRIGPAALCGGLFA